MSEEDSPPSGSAEGTWFTERMDDGIGLSYRIERTIHREQSPFQSIEVHETAGHGRLLVLDGCVMLTERDEFTYHEMLAHVGAQSLEAPRRALVVGGGDGGIVRELLKYPALEVTQAEIDERVVRVSQEHLPALSGGLSDARVTLAFRDGAAFLAEAAPGSLDLVVVDSTDPVGPAQALIGEGFYAKVARALDPGGVLVAQTQSPFQHPEEIRSIYASLAANFAQVWMFWGVCPSYLGFLWTFCFASAERRPVDRLPPADDHRALGTSYYGAEIHTAAFALPPFLADLLPEGSPQRPA